jgi:hypothetical protein
MLDQRTTSNYMILVELWIGHSLSVFAPSRVANVKSAPLVSVIFTDFTKYFCRGFRLTLPR